MPLHLLGKKSWNVYNAENVERVKRDEAAARAADEEAEQNQHHQDADLRLQALRSQNSGSHRDFHDDDTTHSEATGRKRKRIETDDFATRDRSLTLQKRNNPTYHDKEVGRQDRHGTVADKERTDQLDRISNMKFRDAGGRQSSSSRPWYLERDRVSETGEQSSGLDVWGNEDPRRQERDRERVNANDPLVSMKRGVTQLREAEKQRQEWKAQRERDLYEVEELARRHRRHRKKRHSEDSRAEAERKGKHGHKHRSSKESKHEGDERSRDT